MYDRQFNHICGSRNLRHLHVHTQFINSLQPLYQPGSRAELRRLAEESGRHRQQTERPPAKKQIIDLAGDAGVYAVAIEFDGGRGGRCHHVRRRAYEISKRPGTLKVTL